MPEKFQYEFSEEHSLFRKGASKDPKVKENVRAWVVALNDPGRQQTQGRLKVVLQPHTRDYPVGECVLGVGCSSLGLASESTPENWDSYLNETKLLPEQAMGLLGLRTQLGAIATVGTESVDHQIHTTLSKLNDTGWPLPKLGRLIENFWKTQFGEDLWS